MLAILSPFYTNPPSSLISYNTIANPKTAAMAPPAGSIRLLSPHALLVDAGAALDPLPVLLPLAGLVVAPATTVPVPVSVPAAVAVASVPVLVLAAAAEVEDGDESSDMDVALPKGPVSVICRELPGQMELYSLPAALAWGESPPQ